MGFQWFKLNLKEGAVKWVKLTNKYFAIKIHSFGSGSGLFQFVQLFVISNGVNTKYFLIIEYKL